MSEWEFYSIFSSFPLMNEFLIIALNSINNVKRMSICKAMYFDFSARRVTTNLLKE